MPFISSLSVLRHHHWLRALRRRVFALLPRARLQLHLRMRHRRVTPLCVSPDCTIIIFTFFFFLSFFFFSSRGVSRCVVAGTARRPRPRRCRRAARRSRFATSAEVLKTHCSSVFELMLLAHHFPPIFLFCCCFELFFALNVSAVVSQVLSSASAHLLMVRH